jgi:hypothetical protein
MKDRTLTVGAVIAVWATGTVVGWALIALLAWALAP